MTRLATAEDQERWIDAARCATAGQLERLVRGVRRARKVDEDAADPELATWRTRATKSYDDDGNAVYRIVLPAERPPSWMRAWMRCAKSSTGGPRTLPRKQVLHRTRPLATGLAPSARVLRRRALPRK